MSPSGQKCACATIMMTVVLISNKRFSDRAEDETTDTAEDPCFGICHSVFKRRITWIGTSVQSGFGLYILVTNVV